MDRQQLLDLYQLRNIWTENRVDGERACRRDGLVDQPETSSGQARIMASTRIRDIRKQRKLTLQELAARVGTTAQTIQRLETDSMTVSVDWLTRIAAALDLEGAALLADTQLGRVRFLGACDLSQAPARPDPTGSAAMQSLAITGENPVAVRLTAKFGAFEPGTLLIADMLANGDQARADGRHCLVALAGGEVMLRRVSVGHDGEVTLRPCNRERPVERGLAVAWMAPLLMAVRQL